MSADFARLVEEARTREAVEWWRQNAGAWLAYTGPIAGRHIDALAAAARAYLEELEAHNGR